MISKKNGVLIFEPKIFLINTLTDKNPPFPFKKNEIFGGILFHMTTCGTFFFLFWHAQKVKGCDFS